MSEPLSPLAWILIILLAIFIIGINLSLFLGMRRKKSSDTWVERLINARDTAKDPFRKDNEKMDELSEKVRELKSIKGMDTREK